MEYRSLPHGAVHERISVLGLGLGGIQDSTDAEIEETVGRAMENGVNFFDLCAGAHRTYAPFGRAIHGRRGSVFFQLHLGAVYGENGDYAWSRELDAMKRAFDEELDMIGTDYADFGFLHCVDGQEDLETLLRIGALEYLSALKAQGTIRHIGFSSHTPAVAEKLLDTGLMDMMMFSLNPAYDDERGDEWGVGSGRERTALLRRCAAQGVGVSVMKPFFAGKLLDAAASPFGQALSVVQCLQYAADRPGVLTVLPGVRGPEDLDAVLRFVNAPPGERDYSVIGSFAARGVRGSCVYCSHCQPCPAGIEIALANKYYDLAAAGDTMAAGHYDKLRVKADACLQCGHCDARCPFGVAQSSRMKEIAGFFHPAPHVTEVAAALIWREDRFLICRRPAHKARGLLWEFAGGKLEAGETGEQALVRECREELGVTVRPQGVFMDVLHEYPDIRIHLTLYNAAIAQGEPQLLEHCALEWIRADEIPQFAFCPADEVILERLMRQASAPPQTDPADKK